MEKLIEEEKREKLLKLDKFGSISGCSWSIYISGTGFMYHPFFNRWFKLIEPHVYMHPVYYDFYEKIRKGGGINVVQESSSIEEVLETVSDDIRDTILFNINLFR